MGFNISPTLPHEDESIQRQTPSTFELNQLQKARYRLVAIELFHYLSNSHLANKANSNEFKQHKSIKANMKRSTQ